MKCRKILLNKYVSKIYEACGEGRDFVVILKYAEREEAMRKILEKCKIKRSIAGVLTTCVYEAKEVSVSITGKLILKEVNGRENAEKILNKLLE